MSLDIIAETWGEIKRFIITTDRAEAAEVLVSMLVENDYDPAEIKTAFRDDSDVKRALVEYLDDNNDEDEYEEDYELDEDE